MRIKALCSFVGEISMEHGKTRDDLTDDAAAALIEAGLCAAVDKKGNIVEHKAKKTTEKPQVEKAADEKAAGG